jgi:GAF domain-containing protein
MADASACGRALLLRKTIIIEDVLQDDGFARFRDVALRAGFRSVQSTPLVSSSGALFGMLSTHAAEPSRPSDRQIEALQALARASANAIVRLRVLEVGRGAIPELAYPQPSSRANGRSVAHIPPHAEGNIIPLHR